MKHVFLCGFMGCGKTTVGKAAAKRLPGARFIDLDERIVGREGKSIPEIFAEKGEAGFRAVESAVLREAAEADEISVIATGGGALVNEENAAVCRANGVVVFLDVPFEVCYRRIRFDKNRPNAARGRKALRALYDARRVCYRAHSDVVINAGTRSERAERIAALLQEECR